MVRAWIFALTKKALSGKGLRHASRPARGSFRPRLEALEERLVASISELSSAWPAMPVDKSPVASAARGADTSPPSPTKPSESPGAAGARYGTPGWEQLLRDVLGLDASGSGTTASPPAAPRAPASKPISFLPQVDFSPGPFSANVFSLPDSAPPTAGGMAQKGAVDLPPSVPPSADRAESGAAQPTLPEPAVRIREVRPVDTPDRSSGAGTVPAPRHDRPQTPTPQSRERESAPADSPVALPHVVDRVPTRNRPAASIPAAAEPARVRAPIPDVALLRRYLTDGDQAAFRTIVRQHERVVLGTCQRVLGDPHLAQEAFQATFMVLARKAAALDLRKPLTAWLCKVAFRAALRLRAAAARRRRREQQAARPSAVVISLSADLEKQEIFQALAEEMQRLPEKYRAPLALCYLDGRTHDDAAQLIGLPRGSMAKRIREGLFRLRQRLVARGFVV